jgi:hypothetical protein
MTQATNYFPFGFGRDLPAVFKAMAIACFGGRPAAISVLIFDETVSREEPFLSGIGGHSLSRRLP